GVEQVGSRVRCASPVVLDGAVQKMSIHILGMDFSLYPHEIEDAHRPFTARPGPGQEVLRRSAAIRPGMHQGLQFPGYKSVIDEEIFLNSELRIAPIEVAGVIIPNPRPEDKILSPRRSADRIGLHELQPLEGPP